MKGVIWLSSGLILALLLVSGISVGRQFSWSDNFFVIQDLKAIGQISGQVSSQALKKTNQLATVISPWKTVSNWLEPLTNWLGDLWSSFVNGWKHFFGLAPKEELAPIVTPEMREQIRQEFLAELKSLGLVGLDLSSTEVSGLKYGVMVAPSTGSTTRDEWLKKSLSQMFADQVNLKFDQTGMSGMVTPIFRNGQTGGDYIFILTPLH